MYPPSYFNDPQLGWNINEERWSAKVPAFMKSFPGMMIGYLDATEKCVICLQLIYLRVKIDGTDTKR